MSSRLQKRWVLFFMNNATLDFLFIRPSGNPIIAKGFEEMMNSGDVVKQKVEIKKNTQIRISK